MFTLEELEQFAAFAESGTLSQAAEKQGRGAALPPRCREVTAAASPGKENA